MGTNENADGLKQDKKPQAKHNLMAQGSIRKENLFRKNNFIPASVVRRFDFDADETIQPRNYRC
jgi:hypothetical protein